MNSAHNNSFSVFLALTQRNLKIMIKQLYETLIDGLVLALINMLLFVYLFPVIGMSEQLIGPVFLGSLVSIFFNLGFSMALRIVFDLKHERFIDYQLTLPISLFWLFTSYIIAFFIELFISTAPIIGFSLFILKTKIHLAQVNWPLFMLVYLLILLFYAVLFLALGFLYEYTWFLDNVWPRRLTPLVVLGCVYVPWAKVNDLSSTIGKIFLLNPTTYVSEGLRSTLLGPSGYISPFICIAVLIACIALSVLLLIYSVKKQLNPV